jgi:hypothetical protein
MNRDLPDRADAAIRGDLEEYRRRTPGASPALADVLDRARAARKSGPVAERRLRPWFVSAAAAAVLALLLVPVSYDRTVGHELSFELARPELDRMDPDRLVEVLRRVVADERVRLASDCPPDDACAVRAFVPARSGIDPAVVLERCARALLARGLAADTGIEPRTGRVSGSVLGRTCDWVVRSGPPRDPAVLEARIRDRLVQLGLSGAIITASRDSAGVTRVLVVAGSGDVPPDRLRRESILLRDGHSGEPSEP